MIIRIDRSKDLIARLCRIGLLEDFEECRIVRQDPKALDFAEVDSSNIVFAAAGEKAGKSGHGRVDYFTRRSRQFVRLDAAVAFALFEHINEVRGDWEIQSDADEPETICFDGTVFTHPIHDDFVVALTNLDPYTDELGVDWRLGLRYLNEKTELPLLSAVIRK